jgi:hypothetical protein
MKPTETHSSQARANDEVALRLRRIPTSSTPKAGVKGDTPERFDVRIKVRGVDDHFVWTNIVAESPMDAVHLAFQEHYWPERFEYAPEPVRLTVTVAPMTDPHNPRKES